MGSRWVCLVVLVLGGCSSSVEPTQEPEVVDRIERGTRVTLVDEEGEFARVQIDEREVFVPVSVLKQKSDVDRDGAYSHTLSAPANAYLRAPSGRVELPQQTSREMLVEQMSLNRVFLTAKSKKVVIAPSNTQPTVDGETCWAAYVCTNSECPAKDQGKDGYPYLFINPNLGPQTYCPACLPLWQDRKEDAEVETRYRAFPQLYELPETAARTKLLDETRQAAAKRRANPAQAK